MVDAPLHRSASAPLLVLLALAGLAACADQEALRRAELIALAGTLPGVWDNHSQVASERAGQGPVVHLPEQLEIVRAAAPVIGKVVFLVREHASADARRVLSERLWIFDSLDGKVLVAQVARFTEPARWAGERAAPELLRSIVPQDVANLPGCTLVWRAQDGGFSGETAAPGCPGPGAGRRLAQQWRVAGTQLEFAEVPAGQQPADSDWLRFEQRTAP
jgi:hypothetical protein